MVMASKRLNEYSIGRNRPQSEETANWRLENRSRSDSSQGEAVPPRKSGPTAEENYAYLLKFLLDQFEGVVAKPGCVFYSSGVVEETKDQVLPEVDANDELSNP